MATESPIRMKETRGKWVSHPGAATFNSSPVNMTMDEDGLLAKSRHQNTMGIALNRSGSAPPSMEGSLRALENLVQSSSSTANYSSDVNMRHHRQRPVTSSHVGTASNNWSSSSFIDVSNNSLNLSWGVLPTHKEESEDDRSPKHASNDWMGRSSSVYSRPDLSVSVDHHRGLVDLKQEDLPRPPSPVSDQLHSLCLGSAAEVANCDADHNSLSDKPISIQDMAATSLHVNDVTSSSEADLSASSTSRSISHASMEVTPPLVHRDDQSGNDSYLDNEAMDTSVSDITSIQSRIKALKITPPTDSDIHNSDKEREAIDGNSVLQHQGYQQNSNLHQSFMPQVVSPGVNNAYVDINHIAHIRKFSSAEMQPVLHSSGFTPPTYAATSSYLPSTSPYYSAMQPSSMIYSPQYSIGGYAFNPSVFPPYLTGYPPQSAVPFNIDNPSGPNYNPRASGVPSASGSSNNVDTQNLNSFYGQFGTPQHLFANPNMQFRPPYGDFYNFSSHVDPLALSSVIGGQANALISPRRPDFRVASTDHRPQNQGNGTSGPLNQRRGGVVTPSYFGSSTNLGVFMHISTSTLSSPVFPSSPIGTSNLAYGINEGTFSPDSSRNASLFAGWPSQRGYESPNYTKTYSSLEELKSGKGRRLELSDIAGHVVEFSIDQHGSRFIQQKLETCSAEEKASVFKEVLPHTSKLMTDVFGNYVIQKFFEYGIPEQRKELANQLLGQILPLSLQMYGCRVIQKALEVIELEQKVELVHELDGYVMVCVRDQNGNHVIQKCIESIPIERIDFVISAFRGEVATLSMHPYGCRVIQRILERCTDGSQSQFIVDEILDSIHTLARNQYGNYVTQHVLEKGKPQERIQIIKKLAGQVVEMSQHKFASNVIEKCLEYGDTEGRELLIGEIIGTNEANDNLLIMMKDQYANYVVQKILELCTDSQRDLLLGRIRVHLNALRKYTYGKHIVARFEQLYGEEIQASGS